MIQLHGPEQTNSTPMGRRKAYDRGRGDFRKLKRQLLQRVKNAERIAGHSNSDRDRNALKATGDALDKISEALSKLAGMKAAL